MKSFAELPQTAPRCGSSSRFKTPGSSWRVIQSHDSCMLTAAPPIKKGWFISTMCLSCWWALTAQVCQRHLCCAHNRKQANLPGYAHDFESSALCVWTLLISKPPGVTATTHVTWYCTVFHHCWWKAISLLSIVASELLYFFKLPDTKKYIFLAIHYCYVVLQMSTKLDNIALIKILIKQVLLGSRYK